MSRSLFVAGLAAIMVVALASGCGGHQAKQLGFKDCVNAWNGSDNAARRQQVAASVVPSGYVRAGVQLSDSLGGQLVHDTRPNPIGCRVVLFNSRNWVAFLASRKDNDFRFHKSLVDVGKGDQHGKWPPRVKPVPDNATVHADASMAMQPYALVLEDWFTDGRIDGHYSCAAVRAAIAHLPTDAPNYNERPIQTYERKVC